MVSCKTMTRDFWRDGFTAEDFDGTYDCSDPDHKAAKIANAILKAELGKIKWHGPNDGPITIEGMIALRDEDDGHHD